MAKRKKSKPKESSPDSLLSFASDEERREIDRLLSQIESGRAGESDAHDDRVCKTVGELAEALGVSPQVIGLWVQDPTFPGQRGIPGKQEAHFPVGPIRQWRAANRGGAAHGEAAESRGRMQAANAALKELEFERRAGRLIDKEQAESVFAATVATARSLLEELPDVLAAAFPAERVKLRRRVAHAARRHVLKVLDALAGDLLQQEEAEEADVA